MAELHGVETVAQAPGELRVRGVNSAVNHSDDYRWVARFVCQRMARADHVARAPAVALAVLVAAAELGSVAIEADGHDVVGHDALDHVQLPQRDRHRTYMGPRLHVEAEHAGYAGQFL